MPSSLLSQNPRLLEHTSLERDGQVTYRGGCRRRKGRIGQRQVAQSQPAGFRGKKKETPGI